MAKKKNKQNKKEKTFEREQSGAQYQIKLLLWFLWRGIQKGYKFKLGTEIKAAEKFDDLVFYHKTDGRERYYVRYLQAKSSMYDIASLKYSDFISSQYTARCNLKKYFNSFRKIKQKVIGGDIEDFIISTPIRLPSLKLTNGDETLKFREITEADDFFTSLNPDKWHRYKLMEESAITNSELMNNFENSTNLALLADELAYSIYKTEDEDEVKRSDESKNDEQLKDAPVDKKTVYANNKKVKLDVKKFWLSRYYLAIRNDNIIKKEIFVTFNENFLKQQPSLMKTAIVLSNSIKLTIAEFYEVFNTELAALTNMTVNDLLALHLNKELLSIFIINDAKEELDVMLTKFIHGGPEDDLNEFCDCEHVEQAIKNILSKTKIQYGRKDVENLCILISKKLKQSKNLENVTLKNVFEIGTSLGKADLKGKEEILKELASATVKYILNDETCELPDIFLNNITLFKDVFRIKIDEIFSKQFLKENNNTNVLTFRHHLIHNSGKHLFKILKSGSINATTEFITLLQSNGDTSNPDYVMVLAKKIAHHFYFKIELTNDTLFYQNLKLLEAILIASGDKSVRFTEKFLSNELQNDRFVLKFQEIFLETLAFYDLNKKVFDWQIKESEPSEKIMDNLVSEFIEMCHAVEDYNKPIVNKTNFKTIKPDDAINLFEDVFENVSDEKGLYKFRSSFFAEGFTEHKFKSILKEQILQDEGENDAYKNKLCSEIFDQLKQLHFKILSYQNIWDTKGMEKFADEICKKQMKKKTLAFQYNSSSYDKGDGKYVIEDIFQIKENEISISDSITQQQSENLKKIIKNKVVNDVANAKSDHNEWTKLKDLQFEGINQANNEKSVNSESEIKNFVKELMHIGIASKRTVLNFQKHFEFTSDFYNAVFQSTNQINTNRVRFTKLFLKEEGLTKVRSLQPHIAEILMLKTELKQALLEYAFKELKQKSLHIGNLPLSCDREKMTIFVENILNGKQTCNNKIIKYANEENGDLEMLEYLAESAFIFGGEKNMIKFKKAFFDAKELSKGAMLFKQILKEKINDENEFMELSQYRIEVPDYPLCFEEDDIELLGHELFKIFNSDKENTTIFVYEKNDKTKGIIEAMAGTVFVCTGKIEYATTSTGERLFKLPPYQYIKFSKQFLDNDSALPKFAKLLRNILTKNFESNFVYLKKCEIKIIDYPFCCEKIIENGNIKDDITEFCNKLLISITPNEKELIDIVAEEVATELNLINSNFAINAMYRIVIDWAKDLENRYIKKEEANNCLDNIKRQIASLMMAGCNSLFCIRLKNYHIYFESPLVVLEKFLEDETISANKQILYLNTDATLLTSIKVYQTLTNMLWRITNNYRRDDSFILIPLSDLLCIQEHVLKAFDSNMSSNLLVIIVDSEAEISEEFYRNLCEILQKPEKRQRKKLVFISKNDKQASKFKNSLKNVYEKHADIKSSLRSFAEYYNMIFDYQADTISFTDFSLKSQEEVLNTKLKFQGNDIYFYQLVYHFPKNSDETYSLDENRLILKKRINNIDTKSFFQIIGSTTLTDLVTGNKIEIGEPVKPFKNYISKCYIPRNVNLIEINDRLFGKDVEFGRSNLFVIERLSNTSLNTAKDFLIDKGVKPIDIWHSNDYIKSKPDTEYSYIAGYTPFELELMKQHGMFLDENIYYDDFGNPKLPTSKTYYKRLFVLLGSNEVHKEFKTICEIRQNYCVHWLKLVNNKLFLFYSYKPLDANDLEFCVSPTRNGESNLSVKESLLTNYILKDTIVLIADSAGMGKSTILTNFEMEMQKRCKENLNVLWTIRIDLNSYTDTLHDIKQNTILNKRKSSGHTIFKLNFDITEEKKDFGKVILTSLYHKIADKKQLTFENSVFQYFFEYSRMLIIFDGFDEISPDFEDIVSNILSNLKIFTKNKIWVTSRLNFQTKLEKLLNVFAYDLKRFSSEEQIEYLVKFWTYKWNGFLNQTQKKRMEEYAKKLTQDLFATIGEKYNEFIGIPLQTKMLAEIFQKNNDENDENVNEIWHGCFDYIIESISEPKFGTKIQNLFSLYANLIETKLGDYFIREKEVANLSKPYAPKLKDLILFYENELHRILSFVALKDKYKFASFLTKEETKKMEKWIKEFKDGTENVGLIDDITKDGQILFNHLTYAEYFAACFLKEKLSTSSFVVFEIVEHILNKDVPVFLYCIKHLLFQQNEKEDDFTDSPKKALRPLNYAAKNGFLNCIKHFTTYESFAESIELNKSLLFYAVKHDQTKITVCILLYAYNIFHQNFNFVKVAHFYLSNFISFLMKKADYTTLISYSRQTGEETSPKNSSCQLVEEIMKYEKICFKPKDKTNFVTEYKMLEEKLNFDFILDGNTYAKNVFNDFFKFLSSTAIEIVIQNTDPADLKSSLLVDNSFFYDVCARKNLEEQESVFNSLLNKFTDDQTITSILYRILNAALKENHLALFERYFIVKKLNDYALYDLLTTACYVNNLEILKVVLPKCKELNVRQYEMNYTPIYYALVNNSSLSLIEYIFQNTNCNLNPSNKRPLLVVALKSHCVLHVVKYLIDNGAEVSKTVKKYVYESHDEDIIKYFKETKLCINEGHASDTFVKLIHYIYKQDKTEFIKVLNKILRDSSGNKSLYRYYLNEKHLSKTNEPVQIQAYTPANILKALNEKTANGYTLLHLAAKYDLVDVVKELLEQGAYYNDVSEATSQAAEILAVYGSNTKILLEQIDYLFIAANENDFEPLRNILKQKENKYIARIKDKKGRSFLHYAVLNKNKDVLQFLKVHGSKIHARDRLGKNVMFYAVESDDFEMVRTLFDLGSYYDQHMFENTKIDNDCMNFMKEIQKCFELIYEEKLEELIDKFKTTNFNMDIGDIANIRDHRKRSFFEYAQQMNNYNLVIFFLKSGAFVHEMNCTRHKKIQRLFCTIDEIFTSVIENKYDPKSIVAQIKQDECSLFIHKVKYAKYFHMHERKALIEYAQRARNDEVFNWCKMQND